MLPIYSWGISYLQMYHLCFPTDVSFTRHTYVPFMLLTNVSFMLPTDVSYMRHTYVPFMLPTDVSFMLPTDVSFTRHTYLPFMLPRDVSFMQYTFVPFMLPTDISFLLPRDVCKGCKEEGRVSTLVPARYGFESPYRPSKPCV